MLTHKTGIEKIKKYHHDEFKKFALCYVVGGSKRKPFIGYVAINQVKNRKYNEWTEAAFLGEAVISNIYDGKHFAKSEFSPFAISQHALARVYQRSKIINEANKSDPYSIIPELAFIPLWAGYWRFLHKDFHKSYDEKYKEINLYIPSPNGLFLGQLKEFESSKIYEVRTYIHVDQLTKSQTIARSILLNASAGLENSLLSLFPANPSFVPEKVFYSELVCLLAILSNRLQKNIDSLAEMMAGDNDDFKLYEIKKFLIDYLIKSFPVSDEYFSYLENLLLKGYSNFNYEFINPGRELKKILEVISEI